MAKITPIYQFYTHQVGDILYAYNDETNMLTADKQIGGVYSFIGQGVRSGWEVTKFVTDETYSVLLNEQIRSEQIALIDGYLSNTDSYLGRRIFSMLMDPSFTCAAGTTANLSATYSSGSNTLTNNSTMARLILDDVTLSNNDYVLVKNQTDKKQNGIYLVTNQGSVSQNWVLTRASLLNTSSEFIDSRTSFKCFWVLNGLSNGKTIWTLDIDKDNFTLNTDNINFQNAFEQCVRVTTGDGIVGLYKAYTNEPVYFRYFEKNIYYVWATASPCLATESKCLIVSPLDPDYNYDSYNVAVYLASVQVNDKFSSYNVIIDTVEYDDRRNALQNLEGAFENALRKAFYRHLHLGGTDHPSKINLSTKRTLFAKGPVGTTVFKIYDEQNNVVSSWNSSQYGFPEVRLNGQILPSSSYKLDSTVGKLYLKNSLLEQSIIQITLPLSPQKKLTIKPGSLITDPVIFLTDNLNSLGNNLGGTGGSDPRLFTWSSGDYLEPSVYLNDILLSQDFYTINPGQGTISFDPSRISSDTFYIIIEKIGREITGSLLGSRLQNLNASLFTQNELDIRRIGLLDHVGLVRYKENAFINPTKRLFSSGDKSRFFPEDSSQSLQFTTDIYKIFTSVNKSNTYFFGTKRGLFTGSNLSTINFNNSWNTDNGEIFSIQDDVMRSLQVHTTSNKFKTIYLLTKQGKLFKSFDQGSTWQKVKMPFYSGDPTQITANAFLVSTQIESYEESGLIKYKFSTLLYLGTNVGLFTATIQENQSDADWAWSDAWSDVSGSKEIYSIGEIVTQRTQTIDGVTKFDYDRTIYVGSDKGFSVHDSSGAYVSTKLVSTEIAKGFLWIKGQSANNLLWFTDDKIFISHTARKVETITNTSSESYWVAPLTEFSTTHYSNTNKIECNVVLNSNLSSFSAAPDEVDGFELTIGDLILVRNQTNKTQNGIYSVTTVGTGSNGVWANVSATYLTSLDKWVLISDGVNWARSAWTFKYVELSSPQNQNINIGTDLILFEELYINPFAETFVDNQYLSAIERTSTNQYIINSKTNVYLINDVRVANLPYEWNYPVLYKVNWNQEKQSNINSTFFNNTQSSYLYSACEEGLYQTSNIDSLLRVRLSSSLGTSDVFLIVDRPSLLSPYSQVELTSPTETIILGISVSSSEINGNTVYSVAITSSPTRANVFPATVSFVTPIYENKKVTDVVWTRVNKPILSATALSVFDESNFGIASDQTYLMGLVNDYTFNQDFQLIEFNSPRNLGSSFIYENEFINYYVDPWDSDANVFIYINDEITKNPYSLNSALGKITFITPNLSNDKVKISIIKLNKYLSNTGTTQHAEVTNSLKRGELLTRLQNDLSAAAPALTQIYVQDIANIALTTSVLDFVYPQGGVYERLSVKVTKNSKTGVKEVFLVGGRSSSSILLPATSTEIYAVTVGNVPGIEDKITEAYSNQYYNFNSLGGANLAQLSTAVKFVKDEFTSELIYPKLFDNFFSDPVPVYADQSERGPKFALFYDFSTNPPDTRNSSSSYYIGIEPTSDNSASPPSTFYFIYNPSYSGDSMRIGANNGIWIYNSTNEIWAKESSLDNSSKVYFIKSQDDSSYLMAGTDTGLFEQQIDGSWIKNDIYPQAIYDHVSGDWGTSYTFSAFGKNDGISFVRTNTSTGEFISDHFDAVDEKNVYGLYKQKFYRLVDDGQGGVKQVLVDALYLCTNNGLYGVCEGARSSQFSSILTGREMFGDSPNLVSIELPDGSTQLVPIKYYKIFNSPKPQKNNQPPVPIIILTSNGVYTVTNWRWCDPADASTSDFVISNHNLTGISCTCFATASEQLDNDKFIYKIYVGTNLGVFRSYDDGRTFERCERINYNDLAINDIKTLSSNCLLVATNQGLFYSNDEGDNWYKTDVAPDEGDQCTDIRSTIDSGEYFKNNYLAQTFIPIDDTINKISIYLSRDQVEDSNIALNNIVTVGIYTTSLVGGQYVPNFPGGYITPSNMSDYTLRYEIGFQENNPIDPAKNTFKLTDNLEFDKNSYLSHQSISTSDVANLTTIYDFQTSVQVDKMITQIYYTQNPTLIFEYSDDNSTWDTVQEFSLPQHGGAGKWEDLTWLLRDSDILAPSPTATAMGANNLLGNYSYKITSITYFGETTASTVTVTANSTLSSLNYVRLQWQPVAGAIRYAVYGRVAGVEKKLSEITPVTSPIVFDDIGTGPSLGAASPPLLNTSANMQSRQYYRLSLKDEKDLDLVNEYTREVRIGDYRLYLGDVQYLLPEKLTASEIQFPGFKSFMLNVQGLSTSSTYALVVQELDYEENNIIDPDQHIVKWHKTNL